MQEDAPVVFPGPTEQAATAGGGGAAPGLPQRGNVRGPDTGRMFGAARAATCRRRFAEPTSSSTRNIARRCRRTSPMETHGIVADWRDDELTIYASTQFTLERARRGGRDVRPAEEPRARHQRLHRRRLRREVRHRQLRRCWPSTCRARRGAPVRLMLDRREEHVVVGNRPSSLQRLKVGARRDGTLTAMRLESYGTRRRRGRRRRRLRPRAMYPCPNVSTEQYDVFTNAGPCAAFRAPGQVQGIFALEQSIDELAERLGIDPLALRDRIDTSDTDDARARRVERRIGAEKFGWTRAGAPGADAGPGQARHRHGAVAVGVGHPPADRVRSAHHAATARSKRSPARRTSAPARAPCWRRSWPRSSACAPRTSARTSATRGIRAGPPSGGSRVTGSLTPAARNAAYRAARDLAARLAPALDANADDIVFQDGRVGVRGAPATWLSFKDAVQEGGRRPRSRIAPTPRRLRGLHDVDAAICGRQARHRRRAVRRGRRRHRNRQSSRCERIVAVHDCGRPINPKLTESQIYGGVIQGLSYALYEERHLDPASGLQLNANIDQYKIVGSREIAGDRRAHHRAAGRAVVDRRARRRRAGQRRDRRGHRQRVLQRDRQADPHAADDARERARGAARASAGADA